MNNNPLPPIPEGHRTVMPFIITDGAERLIGFLQDVFGAVENKEAFARDTDGLVIHSEVKLGDSIIALADRKEGWLFTPSFLQVYVSDAQATLERAEKLEARIVTKPTEVFGVTFSRFLDPWGNLWWVWEYAEGTGWEGDGSSDESRRAEEYVYNSLIEAMNILGAK